MVGTVVGVVAVGDTYFDYRLFVFGFISGNLGVSLIKQSFSRTRVCWLSAQTLIMAEEGSDEPMVIICLFFFVLILYLFNDWFWFAY